ncbi:hypothetical protein F4009_11590 [Candidatus Poribacteria bacterium]|nr:hypothetical protein [Candidatus Poribacteria bacterium]MYH80003.1 hypothetical protein [Candidatus Poribacteria bacterium]MYK94615.1 hypothetical protein [Candidatus Poribacteria bacterium]
MKVFIQIGHGIIGAAVISGLCIYQAGSFGEARHTISIIGAIAIVIASLYLLRSRWIRWGNRQTWLKYHQRLASMGLCLVLYHSAFQPLVWHSWLTFLLALSNLGTGIAVSLTARKTRQMLLRCHLILAPILLVSIVFHGQQKLEHHEFFPLTDVHDVPCARCHTPERLLFHVSTTFPQDLDTSDTIPEDLHWWFLQNERRVPTTAPIAIKEKGNAWTVTDTEDGHTYHVRKVADQIAIYADNDYRSYTCLKCHVHNTEEIQLVHELHGVTEAHRCLICHQTEIDGVTYGRQRFDWEYAPHR